MHQLSKSLDDVGERGDLWPHRDAASAEFPKSDRDRRKAIADAAPAQVRIARETHTYFVEPRTPHYAAISGRPRFQ